MKAKTIILIINVILLAAFVSAEEYFLNAGEHVTVDGKTVKLIRVGGNNAVVVDVDGVIDTASVGSSKKINGAIITPISTFAADYIADMSATLDISVPSAAVTEPVDHYTCDDSDNGKDYMRKGEVTIENSSAPLKSAVDYCKDSTILYEYYCKTDQEYGKVEYTCPYLCEDGSCINQDIEPEVVEPVVITGMRQGSITKINNYEIKIDYVYDNGEIEVFVNGVKGRFFPQQAAIINGIKITCLDSHFSVDVNEKSALIDVEGIGCQDESINEFNMNEKDSMFIDGEEMKLSGISPTGLINFKFGDNTKTLKENETATVGNAVITNLGTDSKKGLALLNVKLNGSACQPIVPPELPSTNPEPKKSSSSGSGSYKASSTQDVKEPEAVESKPDSTEKIQELQAEKNDATQKETPTEAKSETETIKEKETEPPKEGFGTRILNWLKRTWGKK